jgi:hypothetical protein
MQDFVSGKVDIAVECAAQVESPVVWGGRFTEISRQNRYSRRLCRGVGHDGFDERVLLRFTHAKPLASSTSGHRCGGRLLPLRGRWSSEIWRPRAQASVMQAVSRGEDRAPHLDRIRDASPVGCRTTNSSSITRPRSEPAVLSGGRAVQTAMMLRKRSLVRQPVTGPPVAKAPRSRG